MKLFSLSFLILLLVGCQSPTSSNPTDRQQIITTLKNETKYFCARNIELWQEQWSHQPYTSKMYAGATAFEELTGWASIQQFTLTHIEEHPEPLPLPAVAVDYEIHLFPKTALVFYTKEVDGNTVRETRFMVKDGDHWKIARMQTIF